MNSFRAVQRALDFEIVRQGRLLDQGQTIAQETRGWVEAKGATISQRSKEYAHDYRYFPEPDLPPLHLGRRLRRAGPGRAPRAAPAAGGAAPARPRPLRVRRRRPQRRARGRARLRGAGGLRGSGQGCRQLADGGGGQAEPREPYPAAAQRARGGRPRRPGQDGRVGAASTAPPPRSSSRSSTCPVATPLRWSATGVCPGQRPGRAGAAGRRGASPRIPAAVADFRGGQEQALQRLVGRGDEGDPGTRRRPGGHRPAP